MNAKRISPIGTAQVSARVPKDVQEYLQKLADDHDRSLSWVVGYVLKEWVAQGGGLK